VGKEGISKKKSANLGNTTLGHLLMRIFLGIFRGEFPPFCGR
jgi:hypothetical protein